VRELKLNGVVINSHTRSEYLDEEKYWPIFEAAQRLGVAVYIHPRSPSALMAQAYKKYGLETGIYGFQAETGLHGLRLICSGVFDRFPDLRIVLGHLGEGIPFWLYRVDYMHPVRSSHNTRPKLALTPSEYFKRHFMITTSGMNWHPALRFFVTRRSHREHSCAQWASPGSAVLRYSRSSSCQSHSLAMARCGSRSRRRR
jgi:predicted TIM-barrel fold metal-dependent hydrolase